ncbi:MAG TPA: preprotein translocase subunit SecE [Candidatus Hydrogenedentes bacterium]|nr:preprotein translocase subunit SecE [Candidatus Hydrogenedentota bacterium]HOL78369.1 preprotein translocase subunit SecE [Candidatus Hydrogenedentota bacterium]HPO87610.1 preprotein translocase subunit SecE [Candidatus Hydrogenedentota bacterium]
MAKQTSITAEKPSALERLKNFIEEVKTELGKVSWPTKEDIKGSTQVVLFLLVAVAVVVYAYDMVFRIIVLGLLTLLG